MPHYQRRSNLSPLLLLGILLFTLYLLIRVSLRNANARTISPHLTQIRTLDPLPKDGRLVFIGDVHGCVKELNQLLEKLEFNPTRDKLVLTGDLVSKGPDSLGVLSRAAELGAICVRGNNDDKVIRWKVFLDGLPDREMQEYLDPNDVPLDLKLNSDHELIARIMDDSTFQYLISCPLILDVPSFGIYVVHGGLMPGIPLRDQVPYDVMNMRNIKKNGKPTKSKNKGRSWSKVWNEAQIGNENPRTVVYGHQASRGLNIKKFSIGIDTGCVYGGELTAYVLPERKLVSVHCDKYTDDD
ncbi:uncharacterized protein VTP21DRAFT_4823 [Calcarisporiella thermophila]|uniref:uncharacterized protein n=1 Tax=Calcarisporiella thermophila TaxID=911321 RepID=UPI003743B5FD